MASLRRGQPAERIRGQRDGHRLTKRDGPVRDGSSFTRDQVDEIQRSRVLGALREVVSADGVGAATVAQVVARAGVSRRTFYELFADRDACFLAALDEAVTAASGRVIPPFRAPGRWSERVRGSLQALLALFDEQPDLAALCVVHALGAGPAALRRRAAVLRALAAAIDEGRAELRGTHESAPLAAEGVVGAVLTVLHSRLSGEQPAGEPLSALLGPLMSMIVLPYLGPAAAARELTRPAPAAPGPRRGSPEDPLRGLDMRLTYRTVRVLLAIAARPDASNRDVADVAGIVDQGQTSKLLQRLQHLGLVDNAVQGCPRRGEPNAWRLTRRGEQLLATIDSRTVAAED